MFFMTFWQNPTILDQLSNSKALLVNKVNLFWFVLPMIKFSHRFWGVSRLSGMISPISPFLTNDHDSNHVSGSVPWTNTNDLSRSLSKNILSFPVNYNNITIVYHWKFAFRIKECYGQAQLTATVCSGVASSTTLVTISSMISTSFELCKPKLSVTFFVSSLSGS